MSQQKIPDASFWNSSEDISRVFLSCRFAEISMSSPKSYSQQSLASKLARSAAWLLWRQRSFRTSSRRDRSLGPRIARKARPGPWHRATSNPRRSTRTPESEGALPGAKGPSGSSLGHELRVPLCPGSVRRTAANRVCSDALRIVSGTTLRTNATQKLMPTVRRQIAQAAEPACWQHCMVASHQGILHLLRPAWEVLMSGAKSHGPEAYPAGRLGKFMASGTPFFCT